MVRTEAAPSENFQIRQLLWDELKLDGRAVEEQELRSAIGSHLVEGNEELRQELEVLVEILTEFQQQNDDIREALAHRPHIPEPPGRSLLIEKLKLLAADLHDHSRQSPKDVEVLNYVLDSSCNYRAPMTPRMDNLSSAGDGIALRPGTTLSSRRPPTGGSQRPVSRGSTISISSVTAILDSPGVHRQLNLDEIDGIKEELRGALDEERLLLLEDIEFIQGCLEMEKDLIDDDRRKVATGNPRPSLSDLHDLRKTLEKTLQDQDAAEKMENLLRKANTFRNRKLSPVPPPATTRPIRSSPSPSLSRNGSATRVLKIRHLVQESRDEPYLS